AAQNAIAAFRRSRALKELAESVTDEDWNSYQLAMFDFLHIWMERCERLEQSRFGWDETATLDYQKNWYQEWFEYAPRPESGPSALAPPTVRGNYQVTVETTEGSRQICANGIDCS